MDLNAYAAACAGFIDLLSDWSGIARAPPVHNNIFLSLFRDVFTDYTKFQNKRYKVITDTEFEVTST